MSCNRSVLLIDDDFKYGEMVADLLAQEMVRLVTASELPTALQMIATAPPDAVVLEMMLFGSSEAFALVAELRQAAGRTLPVIMKSGYADEEAIARARASGVDEFLVYPFIEQLAEVILRVCRT